MDTTTDNSTKTKKLKTASVLIIIALLIGLSSALGALYYQSKQDKDTLENKISKISRDKTTLSEDLEKLNKKKPAPIDDTQTKPGETIQYKEIPELGVKYKVNEQNKGLTYSFNYKDAVNFSTVEYTNKYHDKSSVEAESCGSDSGAGGTIIKAKPGETVVADRKAESYPNAKKLGDYYYVFINAQFACGGDITLSTQVKDLTENAFNSLELIH